MNDVKFPSDQELIAYLKWMDGSRYWIIMAFRSCYFFKFTAHFKLTVYYICEDYEQRYVSNLNCLEEYMVFQNSF